MIEYNKKILISILARDKEISLPLYLDCIYKLNYDKKLINLYIKTNDNSDNTEKILMDFVESHKEEYSGIEFDNLGIDSSMTNHHDWNPKRFSVLGKIRNESLLKTLELKCDYYFVVDCDNFILPHTLKNLIDRNSLIVSPFLKSDDITKPTYSNYHFDINAKGYSMDGSSTNHLTYYAIYAQKVKGLIECKVIHCTYLIKSEVIQFLNYVDNTERHEYVIFSESARKNNIPQYLDNTEIYGMITFQTDPKEKDKIEENFKKMFNLS